MKHATCPRSRRPLHGLGLMIMVLAVLVPTPRSRAGLLSSFRLPTSPGRTTSSIETLFPGVIRGVVIQLVAEPDRQDNLIYGLVMQNTSAAADDDPSTAEGLYVRLGTSPTMSAKRGTYKPAIGDEIIVRGKFRTASYRPILDDAELVRRVRGKVDLDLEVSAFVVDPPQEAAAAAAYWESRQGMRCIVPAGAVVQGSHYTRWGGTRSEITLIRGDHPVRSRDDAYHRRLFRDAHPLDDQPDVLFDNGNGARITIGDGSLKFQEHDVRRQLPFVRTFDYLLKDVSGVVLRNCDSYIVHLTEEPRFVHGARPDQNHEPQPSRKNAQLRLATYNLENLYDFRDDPFDPEDFYEGDVTSGKTQQMRRVFNYVPESLEEYQAKLDGLAQQIIKDLHSPDVLLIQEIEDQDIGEMHDGVLQVGVVNNRDGQPDVLQDLIAVITANDGPAYAAMFDRHGADERGIICAFLYRTDRLAAKPLAGTGSIFEGEPVATMAESIPLTYGMDVTHPRALNAYHGGLGLIFPRAMQVARFESIGGTKAPRMAGPLYVLNNHFTSRPDHHVGQRMEQARLNAAAVQAIRSLEPDALIVVGGDLNTLPRPDEPTPDDPRDQLGSLYDVGLANLYDELLARRPEAAYTYVYQGQAQTLDHLFVSDNLRQALVDARALHINSDYSGDPKEPARHCSDHDPVVATFEW